MHIKKTNRMKNLPGELWKDVVGFEKQYRISSLGRLYSNFSKKILKPKPFHGYPTLGLYSPQRRKNAFIHTLVLDAFVGPCPKGYETSHLDGNRLNCILSNLAWETPKVNNQRKRQHGTYQEGEKSSNHRYRDEDILNIRRMYEENVDLKFIAETYKTSKATICAIVAGKSWKHLEYKCVKRRKLRDKILGLIPYDDKIETIYLYHMGAAMKKIQKLFNIVPHTLTEFINIYIKQHPKI